MNIEDDRNIDKRIAAALRKAADIIERGDKEITKAVSLAASVSAPSKKRTAKMPEKPIEPKPERIICGRKDNNQTNVYQILLDEFGRKPFTVETARYNAFKHVVPKNQMQKFIWELESEGLVIAVDELRSQWLLEKA